MADKIELLPLFDTVQHTESTANLARTDLIGSYQSDYQHSIAFLTIGLWTTTPAQVSISFIDNT